MKSLRTHSKFAALLSGFYLAAFILSTINLCSICNQISVMGNMDCCKKNTPSLTDTPKLIGQCCDKKGFASRLQIAQFSVPEKLSSQHALIAVSPFVELLSQTPKTNFLLSSPILKAHSPVNEKTTLRI